MGYKLHQYYFLEQDKHYQNIIALRKAMAQTLDWTYDFPVFCLEDNKSTFDNRIFSPIIEGKETLVVQKIRNLFYKYTRNIIDYPCILGIHGKLPQELYYAIHPIALNCLSKQTEYNHLNEISTLVLNQEKIGPHAIFSIHHKQYKNKIIINIEILEKILDLNCFPISFTPILTTYDHRI